MKSAFFLSILLAILFVSQDSFGQQSEMQIKLRLAQSYEQSGDWENAIRLYEELSGRDSTNFLFADALRRGYLALKRYEEAERVVQQQLRHRPSDSNLLSQLGIVYARAGNEVRAIETWNKAIATDRRNQNVYRLTANAATECRMFERAISFYQRGRTEGGDPNIFATELAYLHSIMMNYSDATREYLILLRQNVAQLAYVQSRLASYTSRTDGLNSAIAVVENAARAERSNIGLQHLLVWLYMEGKRFENAYEAVLTIDRQTNGGGREVYNFAERALKEKAYPTALKAFRTLTTDYPKFELIALARFGVARSLEEMIPRSDTADGFWESGPLTVSSQDQTISEVRPRYTAALDAYNGVVQDFPKTEVAVRSLIRIASFQYQRFFDLDAATATLNILQRNYTQFFMLAIDAALLAGDVQLARGDMELASDQFSQVLKRGGGSQLQKDRAQYRLAEIEFFRGRYEDATNRLLEITKNPSSDAANDALTLLFLIQDNSKRSTEALTDFARSLLLTRQRKLSEAAANFESMIIKHGKTPIVEQAFLLLGEVLVVMQRFNDALAVYNRYINEKPESIHLDKARLRIARIFENGLRDADKAIASYQMLLEKHPGSIYTALARKRIRHLRGESL